MRKKKLNVGSHLVGEVTVARKSLFKKNKNKNCAAFTLRYNGMWSKSVFKILGLYD